jgi:hypothetical protein
MQREFRITLNDGDSEDLLIPHLQAEARERFLFELFHRFFRTWKHTDDMVDIEEVKEKLFELRNKYNITLKDE